VRKLNSQNIQLHHTIVFISVPLINLLNGSRTSGSQGMCPLLWKRFFFKPFSNWVNLHNPRQLD